MEKIRKITIRFVERCNEDGTVKDYLLQLKKWYGWRYASRSIYLGYGTLIELCCKDTKKELLDMVLDTMFMTCKKYVSIEEHPSIKLY